MFEPIYIDVSDLASEFVMSEEEVKSLSRYILARIADEYVREWEHQIDQNLHSTRNEYKRGIFSEQPDDYNIIIGLTPRQSPMAMMLEEGASQFDMKEGMKNSPKAKQKKSGGWYLTVPFKFATSEAIGESGFSNKMPKPIEQLVKVMKEPLKLGNIPEPLRALGQNQTSGYKHKFNIYEGLQRTEIGSGAEKRGGYMTFRRVSDKSDKDAWQHPGLEALNLMDKAAQEIDIGKLIDLSVQEFLDEKRG